MNLITGTAVILESKKGRVPGTLVHIDESSLKVMIDSDWSFFPVGKNPQEFVRKGNLWRRMFPDPFTRTKCFSHRESFYRLTFSHPAS